MVDGEKMDVSASLQKNPKVRISYDEMEAYLLLPTPAYDVPYKLDEVMDIIKVAGVKIGVDEAKIASMIEDHFYDRECMIAQGITPVNGVDGFYEYHFDPNLNKKPTRREDGTVDYWSIHSVELVEEGQVIATYTEPIDGSNGMTVKGKLLIAKRGRPLPPLTGKGFERSEDNKTYTATMEGKIEMSNNRILISQVHEVFGDVGLNTGNIDFRGDVIIHGNVPTGAVIRATGSVTVDGTVEGCLIDANKDVTIRGGMLGGGRGTIKTRGNLNAKFLEYANVKADGQIVTDSLINCNVVCNDKVYLEGKHASVVGGVIHAAAGVEAYNFGNEYGVKTEIYVGVNMEVKKEINYHENCIKESQDIIEKINIGLKQFDEAIKAGIPIDPNDGRKASLLRTKIVKQADLATHTQQLNYMNKVVENAHGACVKAVRDVYSGVIVGINDSTVTVKENQSTVAFFERNNRVVMISMKDEIA
ncbi:MAG: DUF342 domain-containing protein [Agathobacter sp.]|nr:DUF342 domain-containing protein [Agathobacter sp.]